MIFYHVTQAENLQLILDLGILPQRSRKSQKLSRKPVIFLFKSAGAVTAALEKWKKKPSYSDDVLVVLKLELPDSFNIHQENSELYTTNFIPPQCIKHFQYE